MSALLKCRGGLRPRGVADAVVGVEVVDELQDDAVGVGPRAFADRTGREVDLVVAEPGVAAEQRVLPNS